MILGIDAGGTFTDLVLLNDAGRAVLCNRRANRSVSRNDGLGRADGTLHAEDAGAEGNLQQRIAETTAPPPGADSGSKSGNKSESGNRNGRYISERFLAFIVTFAALGLRLLHVLFTAKGNPLASDLILDAAGYDKWAKVLVWGGPPVSTRIMQAIIRGYGALEV